MAAPLPVAGALGPMQRRLGAIVLSTEVPVVLLATLAVWGLTSAQKDPRATTFLVAGLVLTVLAVVAAGLLRRPYGVTLGWVVQIVGLAGVLIDPVVLLAALIFTALWITALVQGRKMDHLTDEYHRTHGTA